MNGKVVGSAITASVALACFTAQAMPTQEEVDAARGECHQHKLRVQEMESTTPHESVVLSEEHGAWVAACTRAHYLMEELNPEYKPQTFSEGTQPGATSQSSY